MISLFTNTYIYEDSISYIYIFLIELLTFNNLIGLFIFSAFILFSGKAGKILDTTAKVVGIVTGVTVTAKHWGVGSGSGSDNNNNKDEKKDDKKDDNNKNDKKNDDKGDKSNK